MILWLSFALWSFYPPFPPLSLPSSSLHFRLSLLWARSYFSFLFTSLFLPPLPLPFPLSLLLFLLISSSSVFPPQSSSSPLSSPLLLYPSISSSLSLSFPLSSFLFLLFIMPFLFFSYPTILFKCILEYTGP